MKKNEKEKKEKKKRLPFKKTVANNVFALKAIWIASPIYLIIYLGSSIVYGTLDFLSDSYLLRKIVNGIANGDSISGIITFTVILGIITVATYTALNWFWNIVSPKMNRLIAAHIEKMLFFLASTLQ